MQMKEAENLTGHFGFYRPDPGNGLSPMEVLQHSEAMMQIYADYKLGGMEMPLDAAEWMSIDEMEKNTLAVLKGKHSYKERMLEDRILAMARMQRFLLKRLTEIKQELEKAKEPTTVVVELDGGTIVNTRASKPVHVIFMEEDIEGGDTECIMDIRGETKYVSEWHVAEHASEECANFADPFYTNTILQELKKAESAT